MKKSVLRKVLAISLISSVMCSVTALNPMSVSAWGIIRSSDIPYHSVGVVGSFNGWDSDIRLRNANGVYQGDVYVPEVTEDMIIDWRIDDEWTGEKYLQFKVRLDGEWDDSWGYYEPLNDRTWNSQANVPVKEAVVGQPLEFTVYFDIRNPDPAALANPDSYAEPGSDDLDYLHVWYEITDLYKDDFHYKIRDDGTLSVAEYTGSDTTVTIPDTADGKKVTSIWDYAFRDRTDLTSVTIPDSVTSIGYEAFYGCTGLTSITIPDSVTAIGNYAFSGCTGLTSIVIPDSVTSIGYQAFYGCTGLTSITIPDSVTYIGENAFRNCTGLTSIVIPDSVTYIGENAFGNCTGLTSVTIGNSVTYIGNYAFEGCTRLKSINVGKDNEKYSSKDGVLFDKDKKTLLLCPREKTGKYTIPDSVTSIGYAAFNDCKSLKGVVIPNSVTSIGMYAFCNCTGLTSVVIPDSVTEIGWGAFLGCTGLTSIVIPDSVTSIKNEAFKYCTSLQSVTIGNGVTSIGYAAFYGCTGLTSVTIGNSVTSTGTYTFCNCTGLTSITIPDSVTSIGDGVFYGCTGLTSIEIPDSVTEIGVAAFSGCKGLADENGFVIVNDILFYYCGNATSIVIPNSVTEIGDVAFIGCTGLASIVIPDSVTSIGEWAFSGCTGLTSIVIPDSVTYISYWAFSDCTGLTIYGTKNSVAETYANEKNIPFVAELANESTISANEIVLGQTVTVNAKSSEDNCTYAVLYKKKTESKWTTKQDFSTNDTVTIKPAKATDYEICVKVKDSKGKIVKKYFDVKVNAKLANNSTVSAENIVLGQKITVNGLAKGGMGDYQYQVLYKQSSQKKWTTAQDFNTTATVTFKPTKATAYDVCVKVKDSSGTIVKKFFTVQVNAKLTNTSAVSATTIKKGSTVTVNGSATGGMGNYTYAVYYKQKSQTKWTTKQDFNANAVVSVKPAQATDYDICVKVKDKDGTIVKKYFIVTVTK